MKPAKIIRSLLLLAVLAVAVVFVGLNVADYSRYRYIVNLDKHLAPAEFKELADFVASGAEGKYSSADMPAAFKKIGATSLSMEHYQNGAREGYISASAVLYERGKPKVDDWRVNYTDAELFVHVTRENQKIDLGDTFSGSPVSRTLWVANPALEEQTNPSNRILTLWFKDGNGGFWVVLPDAIIYSGYSGTEKKPLTVFQSDAIGGAIDMIPTQTYGKRFYDANIVDGTLLTIVFSRDGRPSSKDIMVNNSWCPDLEPLLKMLKEFAPHADGLPTKEKMVREHVRNVSELEKEMLGYDPSEKYVGDYREQSVEQWRAWPPLVTDWWIVWPRLFLKKPPVVLEMPPKP